MKEGWVYFMSNKPRGTLYVGVTSDITRRVWEHRMGMGSAFVKQYGLIRLVYFEQHDMIATAIHREKLIKHWKRSWKVELIHQMNPWWHDLYDTLR